MSVMLGGHPLFGAGRMVGRAVGLGGLGPLFVFGYVLLVVLVAAVVIVAIARRSKGALAGALPGPDAALTIARERLARGEIDAEQYVAIMTALTTPAVSVPPEDTLAG